MRHLASASPRRLPASEETPVASQQLWMKHLDGGGWKRWSRSLHFPIRVCAVGVLVGIPGDPTQVPTAKLACGKYRPLPLAVMTNEDGSQLPQLNEEALLSSSYPEGPRLKKVGE